MDVALVAGPLTHDPLGDEALLIAELQRLRVDVRCVEWDDAQIDWADVRLALIRSRPVPGQACYDALCSFVIEHAEQVRVENPLTAFRWRAQREWLATLAARGVRIAAADAAATEGERPRAAVTSLIYIDGVFTHAVRLGDAAGCALDDAAGAAGAGLVVPRTTELLVADHAVEAIDDDLLFARVDLVRDQREEIEVADVRLLDPDLYLRLRPEAVAHLARSVQRRMHRSRYRIHRV